LQIWLTFCNRTLIENFQADFDEIFFIKSSVIGCRAFLMVTSTLYFPVYDVFFLE